LAGVWARGASKKTLAPLYIFATVEAINFKFGIQLGYGTTLPKKTTFRTKIGRGSGQGSRPKKFGTPYVFLQLGFGTSLRNNVLDQNWRRPGPGEHPK